MISNLEYNSPMTVLDPLEASHGASTTSDRYGFVSTKSIIGNLQEHGFGIRKVEIARVNKAENRGFQKHIVRLTPENLVPKVGDEGNPEIVIINSHDGKSSLRIMLGYFRLVCSNGMIVGSTVFQTRIIHRDVNQGSVLNAVSRIADKAPEMLDGINRMKSRKLHPLCEMSFVMEAAKLRWEEPSDRVLSYLGAVRREEDAQRNVWEVYNRVQENLIKGNRYYGIRRVTSPATDVAINEGLWNLAEQFINN